MISDGSKTLYQNASDRMKNTPWVFSVDLLPIVKAKLFVAPWVGMRVVPEGSDVLEQKEIILSTCGD